MELLSINLGKRQRRTPALPSGATGIYKEPVEEGVRVTALGVEGDAVCDARHHGGPDQAVYVYGAPDYAWWSEQLGRELPPGTFGENLTVSGLESARARIGDRLRVGEVLLEVTSPRIPCQTLARRMGDPHFAVRFREAERPGLYCRVLGEGCVRAGDAVEYEPLQEETVSVLEVFRDFYEPELTEAAIRRFLAAPIAIRARQHKEKQLRKLLGGA
jgi:MOSC domain-containing protein YiiM